MTIDQPDAKILVSPSVEVSRERIRDRILGDGTIPSGFSQTAGRFSRLLLINSVER